jgi:hypothetical protein
MVAYSETCKQQRDLRATPSDAEQRRETPRNAEKRRETPSNTEANAQNCDVM